MTGDIALLTAGGPGIYEPPTLAPWQASIAGLTIGPGTPYEIARISGLDEMPELRTSDESRPWAHGMWDGDDWADGRTIPATIEIAAEPDITYDEALAAWRRIMVPTRTDNLVPFWVNIPHRAGGELLRWLVKVRRHRIPTDEQYEMGLATAELQLFASDPVGYGPQRQDSAGYPIPAGGLAFPLFTDGGVPTVFTNTAPDPRLTATVMSTNGATVGDTRPSTGGPDGGSFFRRSMTTANTSSPMSMPLTGTGVNAIPVVAGQDYTGSWYARKSPGGGPTTRLNWQWYDAAGVALSSTTGTGMSPTTVWARFTQTNTAPVGAAFGEPRLQWFGTALVAQILELAQVQIEPGTAASAYVDGTYLGARWLGTANASPSRTFISPGALDVGYLEFGLPGESAIITMDNPGTADTWATHMVDGPVLGGFEILDIPTGRRLRWTGDIPEGLALTIDTRTGTVLLDGVADRSNLLTVRQWAPVPVGGTSVVFLPLQNYTTARLTSTWAPGWW